MKLRLANWIADGHDRPKWWSAEAWPDSRRKLRSGLIGSSRTNRRTSGGENAGPSPYELLAAALGACTSMTLGMYARRKQWPLASVMVRLRHSKIHANDCADCDTKEEMLDRIDRDIELTGDLTEEQREKSAGDCRQVSGASNADARDAHFQPAGLRRWHSRAISPVFISANHQHLDR